MIFETGEDFAKQCDATDPLRAFRDRFHIPKAPDGSDATYFAGNSLGLQPKSVRAMLDEELSDWANHGVAGHFAGKRPWFRYHEQFREPAGRLVGAGPDETVLMNTLTVNLHLMMVSFYKPTKTRCKILMEDAAFPSDTYAVKTQLHYHGLDPDDALIVVKPRSGERLVLQEDIETILADQGETIALVLFGGVNFFTGQLFDMPRITAAAQERGCLVGFDLAHAAGNVRLDLHDWGVDFAAWCNYKYLNGGPGAVGGCFVHQRHASRTDLLRFGGWWGNDPETRFRMHLESDFVPRPGADGWQVSNPPIFGLTAVKASYDLFDEVGMDNLCDKSRRLTAYLEFLIDQLDGHRFEVITPRDPNRRGCQLSILVREGAKELVDSLTLDGVVCDFRPPDIIRVAPVPLYNTYQDVWRFAKIMAEQTHG